ncbi:DUF2236 domain-containing protein [Rhodocytophaga rosea]|uniref:DUF2236 domain-containing protein n=1 Tax=Rhodocytophaga rosea TaxID=2704465 RepID=A0A6C0GDM1_9BACT|nr:oxygenase MpaB family protein [Rhodocytophaga rosea]QHT66056.1 DUF2236 domain-containing protein [Rhodocytophaga rosea]
MTNTMGSSQVARRIWGSTDAVMVFFAGGAAEFAAIKAVDWLFFTNALPSDPIGRFFDTVRFAQHVFFNEKPGSMATMDNINRIHGFVEDKRGYEIPQWAYKDVLFILIHYGERAHELIFGPLTHAERVSYFEACLGIGNAMHIQDLPQTYEAYIQQRHQHLLQDYAHTPLTDELFNSYKKALGTWRYQFLRLIQGSLIPQELQPVLNLKPHPVIDRLLKYYRFLPGKGNKLRFLHGILLPGSYRKKLRALERPAV